MFDIFFTIATAAKNLNDVCFFRLAIKGVQLKSTINFHLKIIFNFHLVACRSFNDLQVVLVFVSPQIIFTSELYWTIGAFESHFRSLMTPLMPFQVCSM